MAVFLYPKTKRKYGGNQIMGFFTSAVSTLQTLVVALGAGLAVWGVINLLEGYAPIIRARMGRMHKEASTEC
ncbi:Maff2 family mobile element protein [Tissierella simiarum]|uniref:Maff2 family mobile element protein n=1 Tax=Tissierella simiarum TaxID=2841534 RepID=UPI003CCEE4FE